MSWLSDTLGSVAGSVLGSAVQNHYNSANAAQANAWNVENYKHRYQWAVEDMRNAGLNPILAATNGIGGSIAGASAASVGMSDIGSTMNSARAAVPLNARLRTSSIFQRLRSIETSQKLITFVRIPME